MQLCHSPRPTYPAGNCFFVPILCLTSLGLPLFFGANLNKTEGTCKRSPYPLRPNPKPGDFSLAFTPTRPLLVPFTPDDPKRYCLLPTIIGWRPFPKVSLWSHFIDLTFGRVPLGPGRTSCCKLSLTMRQTNFLFFLPLRDPSAVS